MIAQVEPDLRPAPAQPRFRPAPAKGIPGCFIANVRPGQNVLVAVHGISRNAAEIALRFANDPAFAETTIIAPLFDRASFGQYQQLQPRKAGQTPADAALIALLDDIAAEHGIATDRFALFGFSGGAQMAHRFTMFHPGRVTRLCVVSAGWYSMPHTDMAYPYGIGDGAGGAIVGAGFLDVPTTVVVGNRDTRVDASVRQEEIINLRQGRNRLRRARCYTRALSAYARDHGKDSAPVLLTLPGMSHDFNQCVTEGGLLAVAAQALL
jgi:pimeloyl-ACP methyl ester carboxylesterase